MDTALQEAIDAARSGVNKKEILSALQQVLGDVESYSGVTAYPSEVMAANACFDDPFVRTVSSTYCFSGEQGIDYVKLWAYCGYGGHSVVVCARTSNCRPSARSGS